MACTRKFLDLSSHHLNDEDRAYLDTESKRRCRDTPSIALATKTQSGWFVYAYRHSDNAIMDLYGVPAGLRRIMAHARALRCDYILFDIDAPHSLALPAFAKEMETA